MAATRGDASGCDLRLLCAHKGACGVKKKVDMTVEGKEGGRKLFFLGGTGMLSAQVIKKLNCPAAKWVHCQCISFSGGRVSLDRTTLLEVKKKKAGFLVVTTTSPSV